MVRLLLILTIFSLIAGCSLLSSTDTTIAKSPSADSHPAATVSKPFQPEVLYELLVAEIAGSRQQYNITLGNYVRQAHKTQDVGVIARAARIAQSLRAHRPALEMGLLWLKYEPDNADANAIVATKLTAMGKLTEALNHAEKIIGEGDNPLFETIALHSRKSDAAIKESLIERYQRLSAAWPQVASIKVGLSILYMLLNDYDKALAVVTEGLEDHPEHIAATIQQAKVLHLQQKTELAIAGLQRALDSHPEDNRLRLIHARLLTKTDLNAAYKEFERLSRAAPNQLEFKFSQALIALELQDYQGAEPLLMTLHDKGYRRDDTAYYLGRIAEQQQQLERASAYYLQVAKGSHFLPAHSRLAKIMIDRGELQSALNHFAELRKRHSDQIPSLYAAEVEMLNNAQRYELALDRLNEAIKRFPDEVLLRYKRSLLYEKVDRVQLMESDLRYILTIAPDNVAALNALGYFLASHTQRYQEAFTLIEKALSLRPDDPAIMDSMGWVLFKLGRYQQALDYLRNALDKFPDGEIAAHLGEVLWTIGDTEAAKNVWSQGLRRKANDPRILKTLERLNVDLSK